MNADSTPTIASQDLAVVTKFSGIELDAAEPLPPSELVKIEDLKADVIRYDSPEAPEHPGKPTPLGTFLQTYNAWSRDNTLLGTLFKSFEWAASFPVAYGLEHPYRWAKELLLGRTRVVRQPMQCHEAIADAVGAPQTYADDFRLFDRLSMIHGGKFRGSIVLNYLLGIIASGTVLFSLTVGRMNNGSHGEESWIGTFIEIACLIAIGCVYFRGSTPDSTEPMPSMFPRLGRQRWHQRWLEYRVLAERFRYVDMLLPLGVDVVQSITIATKEAASKMWHHRYFEWRLARPTLSGRMVLEYRRHVLAVMIAQERYHARNFETRGAIAHRLHRIAGICFAFGLLVCVLDNFVPPAYRDYSLFFAALLPVLAAAIHGTLASTEYTKVAENSGDVALEVHAYVERLLAIPLPLADAPANAETLADVHNIVLEFAETVINEATGWRAMLRDKNVPLAV